MNSLPEKAETGRTADAKAPRGHNEIVCIVHEEEERRSGHAPPSTVPPAVIGELVEAFQSGHDAGMVNESNRSDAHQRMAAPSPTLCLRRRGATVMLVVPPRR